MAKSASRPKKIEIHESVLAGIEKHAYSNLEAEVGGMLFGEVVGTQTQIIGFVPATVAAAEQISLTFTHEVWEEILQVGAQHFPDSRIVGWYHTHPDFGLFLSDYDQFIQNNFFDNPGQLALVIDPIAGNMGWFEKKRKTGKIEMIFQEDTKSGQRVKPGVKRESTEIKTTRLGVAIFATAIISAALTWGVTTLVTPNYKTQLESVSNDFQEMNYYVFNNTPNFTFVAPKDMALRDVAEIFYGDVKKVSDLRKANPSLTSDFLKSGTEVFLPAANRLIVELPQYAPAQPAATGDSSDSKDAPKSSDVPSAPKSTNSKDSSGGN
jgi:proteasome lid subunit RPN8/RPN11